MNKVLDFFKKEDNNNIILKDIRVYGWKFEYNHFLVSSLSKYLFEDFKIFENIAPSTNTNRDGRIREKKYICVHDTGDTDFDHNAKFWSDVVSVQNWEMGRYEASFQYVTGNDGIYHNIPDNEIAYHAGDSTYYDYALIKTGVKGSNLAPLIEISEDSYYMIDGKKTSVLAPRYHIEKDGVVLVDKVASNKDINDQGLLCKLIDGEYYLGVTYFNQGYKLIANRGGNNNSIGIESCINVGSDIYLTWQRTAKLVAHLLDQNNLGFDDIKQHHYYSGKNCPQTIRMNGMWEHFLDLVKFEYQLLQFEKEGYIINLICEDNLVCDNGRLNLTNVRLGDVLGKVIKYKIQTVKDNEVCEMEFEKQLL